MTKKKILKAGRDYGLNGNRLFIRNHKGKRKRKKERQIIKAKKKWHIFQVLKEKKLPIQNSI